MRPKIDPLAVIARAARIARVRPEEVRRHGKRPGECKARRLACKWLVDDLGMRQEDVGRLLGITQSSVCQNVVRGRILEREMKITIGRIL